jgi:hypothetical protein
MNGKMATAPFLLDEPQNLWNPVSIFEYAQKSSIDNVTNGARFCPGFSCGSGFAAAAALLLYQLKFGPGVMEERERGERRRKPTLSLS